MANYVEVYVVPVKKAGIEDYRRFAEASGKLWREHGALEVIESISDDVPQGVNTSFPQAVKLEADEIVVVASIAFASREDRDRIKAAVMKDPRMAAMFATPLPVDGKRMFWGGFKPLVAM
jgi:uncharacterized protein YbaA (DUF1428 family)